MPGDLLLVPSKISKSYFEILKNLPEDRIEELLIAIERELDAYLKEVLPPKTEYHTVMSITRREDRVDLTIEVVITGWAQYRDDLSKLVQDAINHAKRQIVEELKGLREQLRGNL